MRNRTLLILGGYGGAGLPTARLLLQESDVRLILAGRHEESAQQAAAQLNAAFPGERVGARYADAARPETLEAAFQGVGMVVVCAPVARFAREIACAALTADADYLDIFFSQRVLPALDSLRHVVEETGRCFITQAGFHPGLPAALIRYAAPRFTRIDRAIIGTVIREQYAGTPDSIGELMEEIADYRAEILQEGRWRNAGYRDMRRIDFGPDFGVQACYPLQMEEIRALSDRYPITEMGVYAAGFNWFADYLVMPLAWLLGRVRRGLGSRTCGALMAWGLKTFTKPPLGVVFQLEADGEYEGRPRSLRIRTRHADGYAYTAIATAACLLQYLDGAIAKPGIWMMGQTVEPERLLRDMERMGVQVGYSEDGAEGWQGAAAG